MNIFYARFSYVSKNLFFDSTLNVTYLNKIVSSGSSYKSSIVSSFFYYSIFVINYSINPFNYGKT